MTRAFFPRRSSGFSMIEVLVTILVVSFGLLGLAAMLTRGIGFSRESTMRTVAVQQAYEMADRMRTNLLGVIAGRYENYEAPEDGECGGCGGDNCTPEQLAEFDICTWNAQNASVLPLGSGQIQKDGAVYAITVGWDGARTGDVSETFTLQVQVNP